MSDGQVHPAAAAVGLPASVTVLASGKVTRRRLSGLVHTLEKLGLFVALHEAGGAPMTPALLTDRVVLVDCRGLAATHLAEFADTVLPQLTPTTPWIPLLDPEAAGAADECLARGAADVLLTNMPQTLWRHRLQLLAPRRSLGGYGGRRRLHSQMLTPGELQWELHRPDRLQALARSGLLQRGREACYDGVTDMLAQVLAVPVVSFTLVTDREQKFKSSVGLESDGTPVEVSYCQYVVAQGSTYNVADVRDDPNLAPRAGFARFGLHAYLSAPVTAEPGLVIGTLCVADSQPRSWTAADQRLVETLAYFFSAEIELRIRSGRFAQA